MKICHLSIRSPPRTLETQIESMQLFSPSGSPTRFTPCLRHKQSTNPSLTTFGSNFKYTQAYTTKVRRRDNKWGLDSYGFIRRMYIQHRKSREWFDRFILFRVVDATGHRGGRASLRWCSAHIPRTGKLPGFWPLFSPLPPE